MISDFHPDPSRLVTDTVTDLQMIRFVLDRTYPNPDYTLNFNLPATPTNDTTYKTADVARAFYDFLNNADAKFDRSGNCISIQQYIRQPIFCYKVNTDATTYNETLQVYINLAVGDGGTTTGYKAGSSQLLVVALFDESVRLHYDSEKIINVELIS